MTTKKLIDVKITGYAIDLTELRSALKEMIEALGEIAGQPPAGQIYAGNEEYCHIVLEFGEVEAG